VFTYYFGGKITFSKESVMLKTLQFKRSLFVVFFCFFLILNTDTASSGNFDTFETRGGAVLYTAYNIWRWPAQSMNCLNYKGGRTFIPAGSEVRGVRVVDPASGDDSVDETDGEGIRFFLVKARRTYFIQYQPKYHTFNSVHDFKDYMFTSTPISERLLPFNELERQAIHQGVIVRGMRKEAVLVCYGRPDERFTEKLDENEWVYHVNRGTKLKIVFQHDLVNNRTQVSHIDELWRGGRAHLASYPESDLVNMTLQAPVASPPPPAADQSSGSVEQKLRTLKNLYNQGLINTEEYERKRQQVLNEL